MIRVVYTLSADRITYLKVEGHADHGPYGHDLVCSAVSALTVGGLNNLQQANNYQLTVREGYVEVIEKQTSGAHDPIVLETILTGLRSIEESYPAHIEIERKE